ncbi:leucine-rich repeat receptor-like serine/threonine/tyrosine-protein kinase SOBIR1 [Helianthus annuus]|uniref:leucine-rich repeat receptor-like serine/threonine/tyrosine-protein kinase SOBIR1 n=1 Tax=Helianthus annuus TaxID=4232 RepID=UPI0016531E5A|nr:leucine-rich repeat receptor-like serine/threonine/tyrosine-protein kinase SOBIR1 [Helianthus annuus]
MASPAPVDFSLSPAIDESILMILILRELEWLAKHKISLGVACGLEYLHKGNSFIVVHRDLKPDNVLVDENMEAHISDFGLARSISDANTIMSASLAGYMAPATFRGTHLSEKSDMYSFGVVLADLVVEFPLFGSTEYAERLWIGL